jgi:hypothetical protein
MHLYVYVFTLAENTEDAKSNVRCWLDEYAEREFYDYAVLSKPETAMLVKDVPTEELENARNETERQLPIIEGDIAKYKASCARGMEGYSHFRYGHILNENLCSDMPYFNMEHWDWSVPNKAHDVAIDSDWYAVMVDFHY